MKSPNTITNARYYYVARTVHLERMSTYTPAWLLYSHVRADFDPIAAAANPLVVRLGALKVVVFVLSRGIRILEVPEPLAVRIWPQLLLIHTAVAIANIIRPRSRRVRLVTYAIENLPTDDKLVAQTGVPHRAARLLVRLVGGFLTRTTSVIVFGTQAAEDVYRAAMPRAMSRSNTRTELVWALPNPLPPLGDEARPKRVAFLGTFEHRKGINHLMAAWPDVVAHRPDARLLVMGKAGDIENVRDFASRHASVELLEDPPRRVIFDELHQSKTLVLHSQPTPVWKEQVGLPILEALGSGCEIVSSNETGIAAWLSDNGHEVLPVDAPTDQICDAIIRTLDASRTPAEIARYLPIEDSRLSADRIMFGSS